MAGQRGKARVDLPGLAATDLVDRRLHIVEDPTLRHAAQHPEGLCQRVEQHLVRLQKIGPNDKSTTVRQLGMGDLQLDLLATQNRIILAPVELEGLTWLEDKRNEGPAPAGLLLILAVALPIARKGRHAGIRAIIARATSRRKAVFGSALHRRFLRPPHVQLNPSAAGQTGPAWPVGSEHRFHHVGAQRTVIVLRDKPVRRLISRMAMPCRKCQRGGSFE
jgi:hypothetical protein